MKALRIIFGFMLMGLLLGLSLPVSGLVPADEAKAVVPKAPQGDIVRMTWVVSYDSETKGFYFCGEQGATYKVEWGDGETDTYTGKGPDTVVHCGHSYSSKGEYKVLLYGVGTVGKK